LQKEVESIGMHCTSSEYDSAEGSGGGGGDDDDDSDDDDGNDDDDDDNDGGVNYIRACESIRKNWNLRQKRR